jgi:hypothetical protein
MTVATELSMSGRPLRHLDGFKQLTAFAFGIEAL